jgi:hypothetical protein
VEIACACTKQIISRVEKAHVSLQRKLCMLEIAASSTLFPCENGVRFRIIYFLEGGYFKVEIGSLFQITPIQLSQRNTCIP